MSKQIRGIILEGQSCSGKTSIFNAIKKIHQMNPDNERNVIYLSENYSQNLNLINGKYENLFREDNMKILSERITMLEQLNNYANSMGEHSRRARGLFYVFERFHLNFALCFQNSLDKEYRDIEQRLYNLNAHTILCTVSNDKIFERINHRDSTVQFSEKVINDYIANQNFLINTANSSLLATSVINTDSLDWDAYAKVALSKII